MTLWPSITIDAAIRAHLTERDQLEQSYGMAVPRELEDEVRHGIQRIL
jgi:hypothetical protein